MSIKIYANVQDMTGIGTEWLVINDTIVCKLFDGNIIQGACVSATDKTI